MSDTQREQALKLAERWMYAGQAICTGVRGPNCECIHCSAFKAFRELRDSEAENAALRKHAQAFLDKVTEVGKAVDGVIGIQTARGYPYTGPNWGVEHAALTAALAGTPAQPCKVCADLRKSIQAAPHDDECMSFRKDANGRFVCDEICDCWKSEALKISPPQPCTACTEKDTALRQTQLERENYSSQLTLATRWKADAEAALESKQGEIERLREVLKQHHSWHLEIGTVMVSTPPNPYGNDDLVELDLTESYSESGLCEETTAALSGSPADPPKKTYTRTPAPKCGEPGWLADEVL